MSAFCLQQRAKATCSTTACHVPGVAPRACRVFPLFTLPNWKEYSQCCATGFDFLPMALTEARSDHCALPDHSNGSPLSTEGSNQNRPFGCQEELWPLEHAK